MALFAYWVLHCAGFVYFCITSSGALFHNLIVLCVFCVRLRIFVTMCAGIRAEFVPRALFFVFIDDKFRCPKESVAFLYADRSAIVVRALIIRFCIDLLLDEFQAFWVIAFFFQTLASLFVFRFDQCYNDAESCRQEAARVESGEFSFATLTFGTLNEKGRTVAMRKVGILHVDLVLHYPISHCLGVVNFEGEGGIVAGAFRIPSSDIFESFSQFLLRRWNVVEVVIAILSSESWLISLAEIDVLPLR